MYELCGLCKGSGFASPDGGPGKLECVACRGSGTDYVRPLTHRSCGPEQPYTPRMICGGIVPDTQSSKNEPYFEEVLSGSMRGAAVHHLFEAHFAQRDRDLKTIAELNVTQEELEHAWKAALRILEADGVDVEDFLKRIAAAVEAERANKEMGTSCPT